MLRTPANIEPIATIEDRSFDFALDIIELYKYLNSSKEYIISKQLLRAGTSIGFYLVIHEPKTQHSKLINSRITITGRKGFLGRHQKPVFNKTGLEYLDRNVNMC